MGDQTALESSRRYFTDETVLDCGYAIYHRSSAGFRRIDDTAAVVFPDYVSNTLAIGV